MVRADEIHVAAAAPDPAPANVLEGTATLVSPRGAFARVDVEVAPGVVLMAHLPKPVSLPAPGARVRASFPPSAVHLLRPPHAS
jgi:hypothetical protein